MERGAAAELGDKPVRELDHVVLAARIVDGQQDLRHPLLFLAHVVGEACAGLLDFLGADIDLAGEPALHELRPQQIGAELTIDRARIDSEAGDEFLELAGAQAVARLQIAARPIHLAVADAHIEPRRLLQLKLLVDQGAQNLRGETACGLGVARQTRGDDHHLDPIAQVEHRDDFVVHHGVDALHLLLLGVRHRRDGQGQHSGTPKEQDG